MSSNLQLLVAAHPVLVAAFALPLAYGFVALGREIVAALRASRRPVVRTLGWTGNADVSETLEHGAIH